MKNSPPVALPPTDPQDPLARSGFVEELGERLFVHFVGGRWRAPISARLGAGLPLPEGRSGHLVCADARDAERAIGLLRPGSAAALSQGYEALRPRLALLRRIEGFTDPAGPVEMPDPAHLPGQGPLVLLSAGDHPVARLAGLLIATAPLGVVWKPAPAAAASAHLVVAALGPLAAGGIALVQGDHASGEALARLGRVIWAAPGVNPVATDRRHP